MTDLIESQWQEWQDKVDVSALPDVDYDTLRELMIKDLTYVSQMDVKEYTLYQKWCEIHNKYPTDTINTVFGEETVLVDTKQSLRQTQY